MTVKERRDAYLKQAKPPHRCAVCVQRDGRGRIIEPYINKSGKPGYTSELRIKLIDPDGPDSFDNWAPVHKLCYDTKVRPQRTGLRSSHQKRLDTGLNRAERTQANIAKWEGEDPRWAARHAATEGMSRREKAEFNRNLWAEIRADLEAPQ